MMKKYTVLIFSLLIFLFLLTSCQKAESGETINGHVEERDAIYDESFENAAEGTLEIVNQEEAGDNNEAEIELVHNNLFDVGIDGMLEDLDTKLDLPKDLYLSGKFRLEFDEDGEILTIDAFLYGESKKRGKEDLSDYL